MNSSGLSADLDLAKGAARGDEEALRIFYDRHADTLFAFIFHHLGTSKEDAEEVWQATLLAAFSSLSSFSGRSRLFTWLCAIARHKIADFRRRACQPEPAFSEAPSQKLTPLLASSKLPEDIVMQRSTRITVVRALAALPDDYRRALLARYVDERPVAEISGMLGRSYKATESLLSRARSALRQSLERLEEEHGEY